MLFVHILFTKANTKEADSILQILSTNQKVFGQVVYMEIYESSVNRNMQERDRNIIYNRMDVKTVDWKFSN